MKIKEVFALNDTKEGNSRIKIVNCLIKFLLKKKKKIVKN